MQQLFESRPSSVHCVFALGLVSVLLSACGGSEPPTSGGAGAPPGGAAAMAVPVSIVPLEPKPVEQISEFVGTIKSRRSTTIQPQAEGFLTRILVASGARVGPGTPMFEIDAAPQRAALSSIEAQRVAREADLAFARQQLNRAKTLLDAGAMSQQEFEAASTQVKTAEAQLQSVEDTIRAQQAELSYFRVVAPTAGTVGDIPVRVGDRVTRQTELTTIEDNAGLEAYINVPVQQASRLAVGLPIRIVDDAGNTLAETKISFVAPSVDTATQSVLVKAPVDAKGALRADQFVRARLIWSTEPGLTLPVLAAQRINGQYFAFVAEGEDGKLIARQRPVTVGPIVGDAYVLLGGLNAGDRLILAGTQKIADGAPVQALPSGPPGQDTAPAAGGGA